MKTLHASPHGPVLVPAGAHHLPATGHEVLHLVENLVLIVFLLSFTATTLWILLSMLYSAAWPV